MAQHRKSQMIGGDSPKWLTPEQHKDLLLLGKGAAAGILVFGFLAVFAPEQLGISLIKLFMLAVAARAIYIFAPFRKKWRELWMAAIEVYKLLTTEQKLYANVVVFTVFCLLVRIVGTPQFLEIYIFLLLAFCGWVAFHDIYRWCKAISEHLFGKAIIGLSFAVASNIAYSVAGQGVARIIHVAPTNFTHTMLFIAIAMIPILLIFAGGIVFVVSISISSLVMLPSMLGGGAVSYGKAVDWIFAGTLRISAIRFNLLTRIFQILFYGVLGYCVYISGQRHMAWYEEKVAHIVPLLIYNFDMYEGRECKLDAGYKLAALGDAKFLIASKLASGDINFGSPIKCDDLPSR